jgi:hypothetical protein
LLLLLLTPVVSGSARIAPSPGKSSYFNYHSSSDQFYRMIDSSVTAARRQLIRILQDSLEYRPDIYISDDLEAFRRTSASRIPDWGAAVAIPVRRTIVVKSPARFRLGKSLTELIKHEYSHLALADRLGPVRPPRWLDEGLAMYVSTEWSWSDNIAISQAVVLNNIVSLKEIERLNFFSHGRAQIAYAQSYMAVKYILEAYDIETLNIFIDSLAAGNSIDEAMVAAIGSDYDGFQSEYMDYLRNKYNVMTLVADMSYLWLFFALVVVVGFFLHYMRKRKYYRKWEEEEKYHSTDFDYGDPDNPEKADDEDKPWS